MAVPGRKSTVVLDSSGPKCDPCIFTKLSANPTGFCVDCIDYLCAECVTHHQKIKVTREHRLLNGPDLPLDKEPFEKMQKSLMCSSHPLQKVVYKCEDHSEYICFMCAKHGHSDCSQVVDINTIVDVGNSADVITGYLSKVKSVNLESLKNENEKNLKSLYSEKEELLAKTEKLTFILEAATRKVKELEIKADELVKTATEELNKEIVEAEQMSSESSQLSSFLHTVMEFGNPFQMYIAANDSRTNQLMLQLNESEHQNICMEHSLESIQIDALINQVSQMPFEINLKTDQLDVSSTDTEEVQPNTEVAGVKNNNENGNNSAEKIELCKNDSLEESSQEMHLASADVKNDTDNENNSEEKVELCKNYSGNESSQDIHLASASTTTSSCTKPLPKVMSSEHQMFETQLVAKHIYFSNETFLANVMDIVAIGSFLLLILKGENDMKVLLLNDQVECVYRYSLQCKPISVCSAGKDIAVILYDRMIKRYKVGNFMVKEGEFPIRHHGRSIAQYRHRPDHILCLCSTRTLNDGFSDSVIIELRVLTNGQIMKTFTRHIPASRLHQNVLIHVLANGSVVIINTNYIYCFNMKNDEGWQKKMSFVVSNVTSDDDSNIYVSKEKTLIMQRITADGSDGQQVFTNWDTDSLITVYNALDKMLAVLDSENKIKRLNVGMKVQSVIPPVNP